MLRKALLRAGLPHRTFQGLRATCSSLLRQWGVAPEYVRLAVGHEGEEVERKHYLALDFTSYHAPEPIAEGETPMDLFARLCQPPQAARRGTKSLNKPTKAVANQVVSWRPQRESNPCCRLERAES